MLQHLEIALEAGDKLTKKLKFIATKRKPNERQEHDEESETNKFANKLSMEFIFFCRFPVFANTPK